MFFPDKDSLFLQILYIFAKQWHMLRFNHTTENMKTKTLLGFFLLSLMTFCISACQDDAEIILFSGSVSASAYLNGDVMKNEETGRISYYTSKKEVVYTSMLTVSYTHLDVYKRQL